MKHFDEKLQQLQKDMSRKRHLEAMVNDMSIQKYELESKVSKLKTQMDKEKADVDRMENGSLVSFFYNIVGKKEEKLEQERQEALAAAVKYDAAVKELEAIIADMQKYSEEYSQLANCEGEYTVLLTQKAYAIKEEQGTLASQLIQLEERLSFLENQKREVIEAITAGSVAREKAEAVLSKLDSAKGWGMWDLAGGGFVADLAKYNALDNAQSMIEDLQIELRRFKTELADVSINSNINIQIDNILRFADYVFDGLFMDWTVYNKINDSHHQVVNTINQIESIIAKLKEMQTSIDTHSTDLQSQMNKLIVNA